MQVKIMDQTWDFTNEANEVEHIFAQIQEYLVTNKCHVQSMIVDGIEVYENSYEYIKSQIDHIQTLVFKVQPLKEQCDDLLLSSEQYLTRIIPAIETLVGGFYQNPKETTWASFNELMEGLQWILEALYTVEQSALYNSSGKIEGITTNLRMEIKSLADALNQKDMTLIGDIINYEISPLLQSVLAEIKLIIVNELIISESHE